MSIELANIISFVFGFPPRTHEATPPPETVILLSPAPKIITPVDLRNIEPMVFPGPFRPINEAPTVYQPPVTESGRRIIIHTGVKAPFLPLWIGREETS